jgi:hypothetical protein
MSSKRSYVSGAGCSKEMRAVPPRMWIACLSDFMIWNVVELSSPVEISSMNSAFAGPTSISPAGLQPITKLSSKSYYNSELKLIYNFYRTR